MKKDIEITNKLVSIFDMFHTGFLKGGYDVFSTKQAHEYVLLVHGDKSGRVSSGSSFLESKNICGVSVPAIKQVELDDLIRSIREKYDKDMKRITVVACYNGKHISHQVDGIDVVIPEESRVCRPITISTRKVAGGVTYLHFDTSRLELIAGIFTSSFLVSWLRHVRIVQIF